MERIEVIETFLQNWKARVIKHYEENFNVLLDYYKVNSEYCDLFNNVINIIIYSSTSVSVIQSEKHMKTRNDSR